MIKTGSEESKNHLKSTKYFNTTEEQIHYICNEYMKIYTDVKPDYVVFEALSFSSLGNQTRNLAQLFGALIERLVTEGHPFSKILTFTPTTVKKYAKGLFTEEIPKKTKMDKKMIVKAVTSVVDSNYWRHLKMSGDNGGLDDFCDSWILLQLAKGKVLEDLSGKE